MQVDDVVGMWIGMKCVVLQYYFEDDFGVGVCQLYLVQVGGIDVCQILFWDVIYEVLDVQVFVGLLLVYGWNEDVLLFVEIVCDVFGIVVFGGEIQFVL